MSNFTAVARKGKLRSTVPGGLPERAIVPAAKSTALAKPKPHFGQQLIENLFVNSGVGAAHKALIVSWEIHAMSLATGASYLLWTDLSKLEAIERLKDWDEGASGLVLLLLPTEYMFEAAQ